MLVQPLIFVCSYIQLDLGQLEISNEISWHGCPEKDPSAVRVDALHAKVHCTKYLYITCGRNTLA